MKELSIEEKARRYDEAVINGSRLWESDIITRESYEYIFPELKESEDEKIRKYMIKYFEANKDELSKGFRWNGITVEKCIAWLEKQIEKGTNGNEREIPDSEQKLTDKVELKFKVGDWVVCEAAPKFTLFKTGDVVQISNKETLIMFLMFEDCFRLWDITKDAKGGDVLYCKSGDIEYIVMSKGINEHGNIDSYFRYNSLNGFGVDIPSVLSARQNNITPATKEQRDLLFAKMKEAGYEWDDEKKELNKDGL